MPEVQGPDQGPVPRQHPVQYGIGIQALVINLLVAQMLSLRRAVALVQAISGIKLSEASAMLSRCVMGGGRRGAPPATPDVDDFGSTVSGFMSWDPDVQVPAPQARPGGKKSASSITQPDVWKLS